MGFTKTPIDDLLIFEPRIFEDSRGYFYESYNFNLFNDAGIIKNFVQDNESYSSYGTLRGLHLQIGEMAQAKLVRVAEGKVLDVAVDLRPTSKTFGEHFSIELTGENRKQLYVPRGFAHGFIVLSETAKFLYKCDNFYSPKHEMGLMYDDKDLAIDWKVSSTNIALSEKDKVNITFNEYKSHL